MKVTPFAPLFALTLGVLLVNGIREQHVTPAKKPMSAISTRFAGLQGTDVPIDSAERRVAGMTDYAFRTFGTDSSKLFTVYVGYYDRQVQGRSIHSPKNCLPGAGWEIMESARIPLSGVANGSVNRVLLSNQGIKALVYYWYQGRGRTEASEYRVKWNLLRDAAFYGRTEEALVRIVVPLESRVEKSSMASVNDVRAADSLALQVAIDLHREVSVALPELLAAK